ncbi:MAG: RNase adapter RapZ [Rhodospirillaceae bacterium]|nr:RNase adapter RapZ [Rhodospirillaceae bacterium]
MSREPQGSAGTTPQPLPRLVVVTGMSGAGKSTALHALEDIGFESVDNLPVALFHAVVAAGDDRSIAIGVDARTRDFDAAQLLRTLEALRQHTRLSISMVFLDCDSEILGQRYTESRRPHPLADEAPVAVGIDIERRLLAPLRSHVDLLVDSSRLAPGDLKRIIQGQFGQVSGRAIRLFLMSFGYRHGLPRDADLVFDVRFLKNPHYEKELRALTGLDPAVGRFIDQDPAAATFLQRLQGLLDPLIPLYEREGKSYLTIAVGCTGGQHRSVYMVERLKGWLAARNLPFEVRHRDIPRASV